MDGGASRDSFLMQFQADILGKSVRRPMIRETTALGVAYLAGLATGVWQTKDDIRRLWKCDVTYEPDMDDAARGEKLAGWHNAVSRTRGWARG